MGPKERPDTKKYWPTDRRSQIQLHSTQLLHRTVQQEGIQQNSEKQFKSQGAVQMQLELQFRSVAGLTVWLGQE
jgi:hypothetical protein